MIKKIIFSLAVIGLAFVVNSQTIEQFQVPAVSPKGSGGVKFPSIASNSRGDIMIVFRNKIQSIMYYFKKKANDAVTVVALPGAKGNDVLWTSVVSTADDNFHAVWGIRSGSTGVYYADFDIASEKWSLPIRLFSNLGEDMHLRVNPLNNDIALCTVLLRGNKNIFVTFLKSGQTTWTNEINISNQPHSATNCYSQFDEKGDLQITWKEDSENNLIVKVALIKKDSSGNYSLVDKKWVTSNYTGHHFLPSIANTNNKGIITFTWDQQAGYYYLPYERSGDTIVFDQTNVTKIAPRPVRTPQYPYMFWSRAINHGDEILYTYIDTQHKLMLLRWKDSQWIDSQPIALENDSINKWPYNIYTDPNIGLLAVWFIEDGNGDGHTYYCIYNYPKPTIRPPVNVTFEKTLERSLFRGYALYAVKWANNPYNIEKKVAVSKFNIYRRAQASSDKWVLIGSVAATVFVFADKNGITANSNFEYAVTAVNEKNIESKIQGYEVEQGNY